MRESLNGLRIVGRTSSVLMLTTVGPISSTTLTIGVLRVLFSAHRGADPSMEVKRMNTVMKSRKLPMKGNERRQALKACRLEKAVYIGGKHRNVI